MKRYKADPGSMSADAYGDWVRYEDAKTAVSSVRLDLVVRCDSCKHRCIAEDEVPNNAIEYCDKGHWEGRMTTKPMPDPWKYCHDYTPNSVLDRSHPPNTG